MSQKDIQQQIDRLGQGGVTRYGEKRRKSSSSEIPSLSDKVLAQARKKRLEIMRENDELRIPPSLLGMKLR